MWLVFIWEVPSSYPSKGTVIVSLISMAFFIPFQHISGTVTLNNPMPLLIIRSFLLVRIKWNT